MCSRSRPTSRAASRALRAELVPAEQVALDAAPTADLAALEAYHSGRSAFLAVSERRSRIAPRMFERAVELDPSFAEAWAGLASARSWLVREGEVRDTTPALEALDRARALAPDAIATRVAEAYFHYYARADLQRAREAFAAVHRAAPGDLDILYGLAAVLRRLGRIDEAIPLFQEGARLDPRNPYPQVDLAWTLARVHRPAEARPLLERALRLDPTDMVANATTFGCDNHETSTRRARRVCGAGIRRRPCAAADALRLGRNPLL